MLLFFDINVTWLEKYRIQANDILCRVQEGSTAYSLRPKPLTFDRRTLSSPFIEQLCQLSVRVVMLDTEYFLDVLIYPEYI
jgi:hypothetical protein